MVCRKGDFMFLKAVKAAKVFFVLGVILLVVGIVIEGISYDGVMPGLNFFLVGGLLLVPNAVAKEVEKFKIRQIKKRFSRFPFVKHLLQEFKTSNWTDFNYQNGGVEVYVSNVKTKRQRYSYADYSLANLRCDDCEKLAIFLGEKSGRKYCIEPIEFSCGGVTGYRGKIDSYGQVSVYPDWGDDTIGYKVYTEGTKPTQQLKKW